MAKKDTAQVSETPATQMLKAHKVAFTEHPYEYVEHGGTAESARQLGLDEHCVIKTLVMQDQDAKPLIVLMHGDCTVSTKNLARQIGAKSVEPCKPEVLSGGWHLTLWYAQADAGVHRAEHSGSATHCHQWRAAGLSGAAGSSGLCGVAQRQAGTVRAGTIGPLGSHGLPA